MSAFFKWEENEVCRLQSIGSRRVGHNWATSLSLFTFMHWRRKWQPTPVFLPWRIPGAEEPVELRSMGSHRVGHDWSDLAAAAAATTLEDFHPFINEKTEPQREKWYPHGYVELEITPRVWWGSLDVGSGGLLVTSQGWGEKPTQIKMCLETALVLLYLFLTVI